MTELCDGITSLHGIHAKGKFWLTSKSNLMEEHCGHPRNCHFVRILLKIGKKNLGQWGGEDSDPISLPPPVATPLGGGCWLLEVGEGGGEPPACCA